jgi:type II secretory pathway pseudopilin PulG
MLRNNRGQWAIIELIVVVAIIGILAYVYYPSLMGQGNALPGKGGGVMHGGPATPMERANGVACQSNLEQIRAAIMSYKTANDKFPDSLKDLTREGVSDEITKCPISKVEYSYDPTTGRVWCTTPTHEKY